MMRKCGMSKEHKRSWTLEAFFAAAGSTSATSCGCSCTLNKLQNPSWEDPDCFRKASKFQMEIPKWPTCDQHVINIDFDSISNYAKLAKKIHDIQWQSVALSHWSSRLQASVKSVAQWCIMSHTKACLCSCSCFHLHTGLLLHLKKHRSHACLTNHMKAE